MMKQKTSINSRKQSHCTKLETSTIYLNEKMQSKCNHTQMRKYEKY